MLLNKQAIHKPKTLAIQELSKLQGLRPRNQAKTREK